jgi:hypothetical protein
VVISSENDFYEPLTAYGRWVVVGAYGRCWIPGHVEAGWRPYANGYWQRTDAGWYWVSEEPWGWATYHYGRWDFHAQYGWIWVPHTQWAPAWVVWREGGGYVGWAPLRPSVTFGVSIGVADHEPAFAARAYVFVEHRRMLEPIRPRTVIVNNTTIINKTINVTHVKVGNKTVINEGPRPEVIERASGRKVHSVAVHEFRRKEEAAVAARQRNMRPVGERKVEPPARPAPQVVEPKPVRSPVNHSAEKSAQIVTQPTPPRATPARPTPPRPAMEKPARDEKKPENEIGRRVTTSPPPMEPKASPAAKPPTVVPPRRELQPVEKSAPAARTAPPPVPRAPVVTDQRQRETRVEKKNVVTPPAVALQPKQAGNPPARTETKRPIKVVTAPAPATEKKAAPRAERPTAKRLNPSDEKSRGAEPAEANKKAKGENRATPSAAPTRPIR